MMVVTMQKPMQKTCQGKEVVGVVGKQQSQTQKQFKSHLIRFTLSGYPSNVSHLSPDLMVERSHNANQCKALSPFWIHQDSILDTDQDSMLDSSPSG